MLSFFFTESMKKPLGRRCHVINLLHNMKRGSLQGRQGEHRQADNGEKGGGTRQGQRVGSKKKKKVTSMVFVHRVAEGSLFGPSLTVILTKGAGLTGAGRHL